MLYGFVNFASDESGSPLIEFYLDWRFILLSWAIAIVAATLAGVLPARRSARLSPIEVINAG
jgi:lipoprotein-releasing system permease protein